MLSRGLSWPEDFMTRFDPNAPVQDYLARVIERFAQPKIEILDVGAGPVTVIGKVHSSKELAIFPTDALGREYDKLLDEFRLKPPVRTRYAEAEKLREQLGDRQFDIVHACNSLDHSADPFAGIQEMLALTRRGGFVVLLHEENEGANEKYYALHKWDFRREGEHFVISGPGPNGAPRDVTEMLAGRAEIECLTGGGKILAVMRKLR